jgi:serine/threonine-protein kinase ATR
VKDALRLFDDLRAICLWKIPSNMRLTTVSMKKYFPQVKPPQTSVIIPLQSALTATLPPSSSEGTSGRSLGAMGVHGGHAPGDLYQRQSITPKFKCFPDNQVLIAGFHDTIEVIKSKEKPRKIIMLGSDGKRYTFLCKKEERGDMRKNSRMMEFCTVINRLLKKNAKSRLRQLHLKTYAVLPLTEEAGLIEWVPNTQTFRRVVDSLYASKQIFHNFQVIKKEIDAAEDDDVKIIKTYRKWRSQYPAVLHQWFISQFPEPATWFASRQTYTRSVAAWSMVGFLVGLGDRHGENILLDTSSGEAVHVDFDCLFWKGEKLETPELVPFRLTPNIVSGFGITGVEGAYRQSCEIALQVLRDNHDMLMSVLHTFIHDPLVEWKGKRYRYHGDQSEMKEHMEAEGKKTMNKVEMYLKGTELDLLVVSVHGQVHRLIETATDESKLSKMYIGWMPWL